MALNKSIPIYRITHIDNLKLFLKSDGLNSSKSVSSDNQRLYIDICNQEIHGDRGNIDVPGFAGSTIHDFIPFYFCFASPMLYAVIRQHHVSKNDIIYLVADANAIAEHKDFIFTDCNARLRFASWYYKLSDIDQLEWKCINAKYWGRYNDPTEHVKQYKMAEFLVKDRLEWKYINEIAVCSDEVRAKVKDSYGDLLNKPIIVRPKWYY